MKTTKTITIDGTRYTAQKLIELAKRGDQLVGGDTRIKVPGGEIAIREYLPEEEIGVLNYGLVKRPNKGFGDLVVILA